MLYKRINTVQDRLVYINGHYTIEKEAKVSLYDSAIATGEKVVEVSRTFNHNIYRLKEHIARLYSGLAILEINPGLTKSELERTTQEILKLNMATQSSYVDWQILHYVSKGPVEHFEIVSSDELGPTVIIQCIPLVNRLAKMSKKYSFGADLVVVEQKAIPPDILSPQIKSNGRMDYLIGRLQAQHKLQGSTGVLLDNKGHVTEGTGSSLFVVKNGEIKTAPSTNVLNGITRKVVFDITKKLKIPIEEIDFTPEEVLKADELFITSTIICLLHARSFNNKLVHNGRLGPITENIRKAFIQKIGLDYVKQAQLYFKIVNDNGPIL